MKITVNTAQLKAAALFMTDKDVLHYLHGIFFDAKAKALIATDRKQMYVGKPGSVDVEGEPRDVIMPSAFIKYLIKAKTAKTIIELSDDNMLSCIAAHAIGKPLDAAYPDWRRAYLQTADIPTPLDTGLGFDPELLMKCKKAAEFFGRKFWAVDSFFNGWRVGVYVLPGDAAHIATMPIKRNDENETFTMFDV